MIDNYLSVDGSSNNALEHVFTSGQELSGKDFDMTLLGGFQSSTASSDAMLMASSNTTGNGTWELGQGSSVPCSNLTGGVLGTGRYILKLNNSGATANICGPAIDDKEHLFRISYDSGASTVSFYIDNELIESTTLNGAVFDRVRLFQNRAGTISSQSKIQSVIIYDRVLSTQDASEQEKYLTCQWGI